MVGNGRFNSILKNGNGGDNIKTINDVKDNQPHCPLGLKSVTTPGFSDFQFYFNLILIHLTDLSDMISSNPA